MPLIITDLLRSMDIFEALAIEEMEEVASLLTEQKLPAGTLLFNQGDPGDAMYIVTGGRIRLFTVDETGTEKILTHFGDGDFFGEMAPLTGAPRSASAEAEEDSRALMLRKDAFDLLLATNPTIMREMLKVVAKRQTATNVRLAEDEEGQGAGVGTGKVYVIYSPRGGSGKTTVAVNLAVALAQQNPDRVGLLDLDLTFGHAASMLGLAPGSSLADLPPESLRNLDRESLNRYLLTHHSSLRVFVGANKPEEGEAVTGEHVKAALEVMKRQFLYIVVDTSCSFAEPILAALETADKVVLLCTPELNSVKDIRECQRIFSDVIHVTKDKLVYLMNQYQPFRVLSNEQFEQALEVQLVADLPNAGESGFKAMLDGKPIYLSVGGAVVKAVDKLALGLQDEAVNGQVKGKKSGRGGPRLSLRDKPRPRPAPSAPAPAAAPGPSAGAGRDAGGYPADLYASRPERSSRILALLRPLLALVPLVIASVLTMVAAVLLIPAWLVMLVRGRMPAGLFGFIAGALRLSANSMAYLSLLTDTFPSFSGNPSSPRVAQYPVQVLIPYPERSSRLLLFLRWFLLVPHAIVAAIYSVLLTIVLLVAWLLVILLGRYPAGLFSLMLGLNRYFLRISAYTFLLVDPFPPLGLAGRAAVPSVGASSPPQVVEDKDSSPTPSAVERTSPNRVPTPVTGEGQGGG